MKAALEKFQLINGAFALGKRYRSSFEIIASILDIAVEGVSRFVIANRLNTNYRQLQRYLSYLVRMGFIDVEANGKRILYKTSAKGLKFLRLYHALLETLLKNEPQVQASVVYEHVSRQVTVKGRGRRSFGL